MAKVANKSGVVIDESGSRLFGMDAELHLKREAQRDKGFELKVAEWIECAVGEALADKKDLWISLKNGIVLCKYEENRKIYTLIVKRFFHIETSQIVI